MARGNLVFGALFVILPLILALGALFAPANVAFGLTLGLIAVLAFGFLWGIAFLDVDG